MMKNKRVVIGLAAAALLAAGALAALAMMQGGATPALAQDAGPTATLAKAPNTVETPAPDISAQQHQKLVTGAQELGININGLSDDQIMAAIETKEPSVKPEQSCTDVTAARHQKALVGAQELGINISGLSDDQIIAAIRAAQAATQAAATPAKATDAGATPTVDITALRHQKLVKGAGELGININGLSDDQIMAAIQAKDPTVQPDQSCSANLAQQHQKLVATAQELGIDISGMSDEEISAAIKAKGVAVPGSEQK